MDRYLSDGARVDLVHGRARFGVVRELTVVSPSWSMSDGHRVPGLARSQREDDVRSRTHPSTGWSPPHRQRLRRRPLRPGYVCGVLATLFCGIFCTVQSAGAATSVISITTTSLPSGEVGVAYFLKLTGSGGTGPYVWSVSSGALPAGMSLEARGVITGTPLAAGTQAVTLQLSDATNDTATASFTLLIIAGPAITSGPLPGATAGATYNVQLSAAGGTPPYNWTVLSGPLPLGLVLLSNGLLSGIPSALGTTVTTVQISDALGVRASAAFTVVVQAPTGPTAEYLTAASDGGVSAFANPGSSAPQTGPDDLSSVVAIATDQSGANYWIVTSTGHVVASPGTPAFGSVGKRDLSGKVVGIAVEPDGSGYWLASSTGRVYGFGKARSFGSLPRHNRSVHIVGIALNASATGYWLVSSTGHIYAFGTAHRLPGRSKVPLRRGVVGIAGDPTASGFWTVARTGRVATFGQAVSAGSIPGGEHVGDIVAMAATPTGDGYWLLSQSGEVYPMGDASLLPGLEVAPDAAMTAIVGAA